MKTLKIILSCLCVLWACAAQGLSHSGFRSLATMRGIAAGNIETRLMTPIHGAKASDEAPVGMTVNMTRAGELKKVLGDSLYRIDSLAVTGPVNDSDFYTMFKATLRGRLEAINLEQAIVENNAIPEHAFYHNDEQSADSGRIFYVLHLRNFIFPKQLDKIGEFAFGRATLLEQITLPTQRLRIVEEGAFAECPRLNVPQLEFPYGLEKIEKSAFEYDGSLASEIVLPPTIKEIGRGAFLSAPIKKVNFPEGLQKIGASAFSSARIREIILPQSCTSLGERAFSTNAMLETLQLPEGIDSIPNEFAVTCINLKEINLPASVKYVGSQAFANGWEVTRLNLPDGLEEIGFNAFVSLDKVECLVLPRNLKLLGPTCFGRMTGVKKIYCPAQEPPVCQSGPNGEIPFEWTGSRSIPVYVPKGTIDKYHSAWGWNQFDQLIEIDDSEFPKTSGVESVTADVHAGDDAVYDLLGRKVERPQPGQVYIVKGKKVLYIAH